MFLLGGGTSDKTGKVFLKKLSLKLGVQSSREVLSVQLMALYHLGMVPGVKVLKGFRKPWIFMTFFVGPKMQKI